MPERGQESLFPVPLPRRVRRPRGPHQDIVDLFDELWTKTRGYRFAWNSFETHWIKLAFKQRAKEDKEAVLERVRTMLLNPPDLWTAQNASPSVLYRRWNELGVKVRRMGQHEKNAANLRRLAEEL